MDLLRGDGMDPNWASRASDGFFGLSDDPDPSLDPTNTKVLGHRTTLPHQPARPSSLRLSAAPAPLSTSTSTSDGTLSSTLTGPGGAEDEDMWSLSHMPLDSLSLSFANVQVEDISPPSSPSSDTEYAYDAAVHRDRSPSTNVDLDRDNDPERRTGVEMGKGETLALTGQERICVEALVVRKVQHGHGADGDGGEEEEECGWGGEDDVWGLGVDDD